MNTVDETLASVRRDTASRVGWRDLYAWERRRVGRSAVLWSVLALLTLALCAGAWSGGSLQRTQAAAQVQQQHDDDAWMRAVTERAHDYARPAAQPAPYWQDPTDVAGFSRYQLRAHAYKPVLPLAALAVGASDLAPSRWPVKLETPFGVEPAYDFEAPRGLALGRFDLGFAVATLLPIAVIALAGLLATLERDRGMLRLIAAQPVHPRTWLSARIAAITAWLLPALALALTLALLVAGVDFTAAWPEFLAAQALVAAYALFWLALAFVVLGAWPGAAGAIGMLLSAWLILTLALPMLGRFVLDAAQPSPSRVLYVDAQRRVDADIAAERDTLVAQAFRAQPTLAAHVDRAATIDYATRMTFLAPLVEARLAPWQIRIEDARAARDAASNALGVLAPPLGVATALATLAGNDSARQRRYEREVRAYQQRLRDWFYPRVQREIATPTPRPPNSYARLNFSEYAQIPAYAAPDEPAAARVRAVLPSIAWLLALAAALSALAVRRLARWPGDL